MKNRNYYGILVAACMTSMMMAGCTSKYETAGMEPIASESPVTTNLTVIETLPIQLESSSQEADIAKSPEVVFTEVKETVYITGSNVRIRSSMDTAGADNILTAVNKGYSLERTGVSDSCRVNYQGQIAYVSSRFLSTTKPEPETPAPTEAISEAAQASQGNQIGLNSEWKYAGNSAISSGYAVKYVSTAANRHGITVCVNAGHGTSGGSSVKTLCHPDGTPKVTGGTTGAGETKAVAVSGGMTFSDGTPEATVTLAMAKVLRDKLLAAGYDVVMIRETDDVQLDNVARTVIANNTSSCHIAVHWDSTTSDKGAFYMAVPDNSSYKAMEPVASNWQKHNALGESLIAGLRSNGVKIYSEGSMGSDLTQTSYSTIPSAVVELGDKKSDYSSASLNKIGDGFVAGVNQYFGK